PVTLAGGLPTGGVYSGVGVTAGVFTPSVAGVGAKIITYTFTNANGCVSFCTFTITVRAKPVVTCPANMSVCLGDTPFTLTGGLPAGGTYSGPGVTNNIFNPATAGLGAKVITYTYADEINCGNSCTFTITVNQPLLVSVSIAASTTSVCDGLPVTFTATIVNGGTTPQIQWFVNNVLTFSGNTTFLYLYPVNGDVVSCKVTSSDPCVGNNPATSNLITLNVFPYEDVTVSITASTTSTCDGMPVTFNATIVNGGTAPQIQWYVNNVLTFSGNVQYVHLYAVNGDVVFCKVTSSNPCASNNPAISNPIALTVYPWVNVAITIQGSTNNICSGTAVTYTVVSTTSGGVSPSYQWKVNGVNVGTNSTTYMYIPANGDVVSCWMLSSLPCYFDNPVESNKITMIVRPTPLVTFTLARDTLCTYLGLYQLTGGLPAGGTYTGLGVTNGILNTQAVPLGPITLTYTFTNAQGCTASAIKNAVIDLCIGIPEVSESYTVTLYPNPTDDKLFIGFNGVRANVELIRVFDVRGNMLQSLNNVEATDVYTLDVSRLQPGIYTLQLITDKGVIMRKFIVK
ncbi:MAG: T9SS type A sorting domain-containing protein, partial [Methylotenera sp.]|nr:T9SS type A sorting domain-containing protein [Methylotenera sp.]